MLVCWVVSLSCLVWNVIMHRLVIAIYFVALCTELIYISAKGHHWHKVHILFPLQWYFCFVDIFDQCIVDE